MKIEQAKGDWAFFILPVLAFGIVGGDETIYIGWLWWSFEISYPAR